MTIGIGDTVTVTRAAGGAFAHNVHYDDTASGCPPTPEASAWSCPRTFASTGDFAFRCDLHGLMQGTVHVVASPGSGPSPTPTPRPPGEGPPAPLRTVPIGRLAILPDNDRCLPRRYFRLRLRRAVGASRIEVGRVFVDGRRVAVRRGDGLTSPVVVGRLPRGTAKVRVLVTAADGRRLAGTRRYATCPPA